MTCSPSNFVRSETYRVVEDLKALLSRKADAELVDLLDVVLKH